MKKELLVLLTAILMAVTPLTTSATYVVADETEDYTETTHYIAYDQPLVSFYTSDLYKGDKTFSLNAKCYVLDADYPEAENYTIKYSVLDKSKYLSVSDEGVITVKYGIEQGNYRIQMDAISSEDNTSLCSDYMYITVLCDTNTIYASNKTYKIKKKKLDKKIKYGNYPLWDYGSTVYCDITTTTETDYDEEQFNYYLLSGKKGFSIKKKMGWIRLKKSLKKGTYKLKIKIENKKMKTLPKTVTVTIKVV